MKKKIYKPALLLFFLATVLSVWALEKYALAMDVTLQWDANHEPDLAGYRIYYKSGHSGGRIKENYTNQIQITVEEDEYEDEPNLIIQYTITGLADSENYVFMVTAFDDEDPSNESAPSNEASTDTIPPGVITDLVSSHPVNEVSNISQVTMTWAAAVDPQPEKPGS
jgi:hypothetical protein